MHLLGVHKNPKRDVTPSSMSKTADTLTAMPSSPARIVAYLLVGIFCAAGPVTLLVAAGTGIERAFFIRSSSSADGVVVELRGVPGSTKKSLAPIFRFTAQNGMSFTVSSNIYQSPSTWQLGRRVRVLYQEDRPENAHIDSFWQLWMPQFVLGIVGGGFSAIPLLILLGRRHGVP
jgi:hypothetical protein